MTEVNKSEEIYKVATELREKGETVRPKIIIDILKKRGIEFVPAQVSIVLKNAGYRRRRPPLPPAGLSADKDADADADADEDADEDADGEMISTVADLIKALSGMDQASRVRIRVEVDGEVSGFMNVANVEMNDDGVEISTWD